MGTNDLVFIALRKWGLVFGMCCQDLVSAEKFEFQKNLVPKTLRIND